MHYYEKIGETLCTFIRNLPVKFKMSIKFLPLITLQIPLMFKVELTKCFVWNKKCFNLAQIFFTIYQITFWEMKNTQKWPKIWRGSKISFALNSWVFIIRFLLCFLIDVDFKKKWPIICLYRLSKNKMPRNDFWCCLRECMSNTTL